MCAAGTDAAHAPFKSQKEKGNIVGFDIDVFKAVAAKAGIEVKFVNTPWEGLFNNLSQVDHDIVATAVKVNDEGKQTTDFSTPYFDAQQLIAVPTSAKIAKFEDLKKPKVGVQTGNTGDEAASKLLGKTNSNIKRFESTPLALKELEAGGVDAVVADNGVVMNDVNNNTQGKFKTLKLTAVSVSAGLLLGIFLGADQQLGRRPQTALGGGSCRTEGDALRVMRGVTTIYVAFFRGTPLFVQILLVHFALMPALVHPDNGLLLGGELVCEFRQEHGAFFAGALALNAGAYISEIFRAGVQSIHNGQSQAACSVGLIHGQSMRFGVLPQAFRRMVPALVNEGVTKG